jgi:hypothetical protein
VFYEEVKIKSGETLAKLAVAYGHKAAEWTKIWNDARNAPLVKKRAKPENLVVGDVICIPIPWTYSAKPLNVEAHGVGFEPTRTGEAGTRVRWIQTVYQGNQPVAGTSPHCVDACPPDDADPFYFTDAELVADPTLRKTFKDHPQRPAPAAAAGTTKWRAILSIAVVTEKRVTVFDSLVWGFDMTPANVITKVGPRDATAAEISGHLKILNDGVGSAAGNFKTLGWTFRTPPP